VRRADIDRKHVGLERAERERGRRARNAQLPNAERAGRHYEWCVLNGESGFVLPSAREENRRARCHQAWRSAGSSSPFRDQLREATDAHAPRKRTRMNTGREGLTKSGSLIDCMFLLSGLFDLARGPFLSLQKSRSLTDFPRTQDSAPQSLRRGALLGAIPHRTPHFFSTAKKAKKMLAFHCR